MRNKGQTAVWLAPAVAQQLRARLTEMKKAAGPDDPRPKTAWATMLKCATAFHMRCLLVCPLPWSGVARVQRVVSGLDRRH